MSRIYISPSTQETNAGVSPFGTEEAEMNKIADTLLPLLVKDGRFAVKRNSPAMTPYQCAYDSNAFKADIHVAIHSNAGGGEGTEVFAYGPGTGSEKLAKALYGRVAPLSPGSDRGVKYKPGFVEVGDTVNATACLIELGFHDNSKDAAWMVSRQDVIAWALYGGICDYFGYVISGVTGVKNSKNIAPDDIYLSVRVRESLVDQAIKDINKLGFAAKKMELA